MEYRSLNYISNAIERLQCRARFAPPTPARFNAECVCAYPKKIVIVAGPDGAGKATFAREFLPNEAGCPVFVNTDLIAAAYGWSDYTPAMPDEQILRRLLALNLARAEEQSRASK